MNQSPLFCPRSMNFPLARMGERTIAAWAGACAQHFARYLSDENRFINNATCDESLSGHSAWVEDQMIRFNTWCASLGVFAFGHASIEHRLRDHSEIYSLVIQFLEALEANLRSGKHHLTSRSFDHRIVRHMINMTVPTAIDPDHSQFERQGPSPQREDVLVATESELSSNGSSPASSVTSSAFFSQSSLSEFSIYDGTIAARSEVEDTLSRLIRLSASIRRSGRHHDDSKALFFVDRDANGEDLTSNFRRKITLIMHNLYPYSDRVLRERLAESISRRRNRIVYRRHHQEKLAVAQQSPPVTPSIPEKAMSITSASHIQPQLVNMNSGYTSSRASSDVPESSTQLSTLPFPPEPDVGESDSFECPYCCILCPRKEARGKYWK